MTSPSLTSPAHTPGPWFVAESIKRGFVVRSPRGGFLAWLGTGSLQRDAANAQLMAAAPHFLEYCRVLLDDVSRMIERPYTCPAWDWRLTEHNLRALIALAEGEASIRRGMPLAVAQR